MDFLWSEVQLAFKESGRKFAEEEISPRTLERDLKGEFHWQAWEKAVEFGLLGLPIPEECE
jgi:alkylation response protein AidB-like acyl-CoA dehydrogenase